MTQTLYCIDILLIPARDTVTYYRGLPFNTYTAQIYEIQLCLISYCQQLFGRAKTIYLTNWRFSIGGSLRIIKFYNWRKYHLQLATCSYIITYRMLLPPDADNLLAEKIKYYVDSDRTSGGLATLWQGGHT